MQISNQECSTPGASGSGCHVVSLSPRVEYSDNNEEVSDMHTDHYQTDTVLDSGDITDHEFDCETFIDSNIEKSDPCNDDNMRISLKEWALKNNITHSALNGLLCILKPLHKNLPLDARTLLGTASNSNIEQFQEGEFCYFGVEDSLKKFFDNLKPEAYPVLEDLKLNINMDGIPLYR